MAVLGSQSRLKFSYILIVMGLVEALLKVILKGFPLTELFAFQGMVFGGYLTGKTVNNAQEIRNGKANNVDR